MLAQLFIVLNYKIDVVMLKQYSSISLAEIGVYSVGIAIAEKILLIPDAIKDILLKDLSNDLNDRKVSQACRISFLLCILVSVFLCLVSKPLIPFIFGEEYSDAYLITIITVFGASCMVFMKMVDCYFIITKREKLSTLILFCSILVNVGFNLFLIPLIGIQGAAIATIIGHFVCGLIYVILFSYFTKQNPLSSLVIRGEDFVFFKSLFSSKRE